MLNYKQLHHFWSVAKAGGVVRAAERSGLAPQTLSGQIGVLEASLGVTLFRREGRRLELTETGRVVLSYADEIFQAGAELENVVRDRASARVLPFRVGIADLVPKTLSALLLAPAMGLPEPLRLVCREDKLERLLGDLAIHRLELVLADSPMPSHMDVKGHSQHLGSSPLAWFAAPALIASMNEGFPACLHRQPLLFPGGDARIRPALMRWLDRHRIRPHIAGEFDDSALMKAFGEAGHGAFPAPAILRERIEQQHGVRLLGACEDVIEEYYAITVERRANHPAIQAITRAAGLAFGEN